MQIDINGKKHKLELWAFNTRWGVQSMFFKLHKVKDDSNLEDDDVDLSEIKKRIEKSLSSLDQAEVE